MEGAATDNMDQFGEGVLTTAASGYALRSGINTYRGLGGGGLASKAYVWNLSRQLNRGVPRGGVPAAPEPLVRQQPVPKPVVTLSPSAISNATPIRLRNGYYEAAYMKISEAYYNRLWQTGGRPAPFLQAREVLRSNPRVLPDMKPGFFRYEGAGLELIYNPTTGEIWHIQPQRIKRM